MLSLLRNNQKHLMAVVAVVIIISFAFFGNGPGGGSQGSPSDTAFRLPSKDYTFEELSKLQRSYQLAAGLRLPTETGDAWANQMVAVAQRIQAREEVPVDFAFNLAILREEVKKHQIHVSDEEARAAFRSLSIFQDEKGFNGAIAEMFQNQIASMGFKLEDIYTVLKDWIGFTKLQQLVTGDFVASKVLAEQLYRASYQTIKVSTVPFALEDFKKDVKLSDEEIQKYYDENKGNFMSAPKRGIEYVFAARPDVSKASDEERIKLNNAYNKKFSDFAFAVTEAPDTFAARAKSDGYEVKKVAAFDSENAPAELKEEFSLLAAIFSLNMEHTKISDPVDSEKGFYLFTVTEDVQPQQLELAAVKDRVKEILTQQKAQEALTLAANEARTKIEAALKAGKSFEAAAKDAGVKVNELPEFVPASPLTDISNGMQIATEARNTPAGQFTKALPPTPTGTLLVFVKSKELRKRDDAAELRSNIEKSLTTYSKADVFRAWFTDLRDNSGLDITPALMSNLASTN